MGWGAARKLRRGGRQPAPDPRGRAHLRRPAALELRAPLDARRGHRRGARPRSRRGRRAPGPDRWLAPELAAVEELVGVRRAARRGRGRRSESSDERPAGGPRPARQRAQLPRLAAGGGAADADEQPRPRGRRAARRPRRLRRHRPRGALLGGLRRDRRARCAGSATTRRCSSSRASRSASFAPTSGRRGC